MTTDSITTINRRYSARSYQPRKLTDHDRDALQRLLESCSDNPLNIPVRFTLLQTAESHRHLGTYGVITGAKSFIAASVVSNGDDEALEAYGFSFERIILGATEMGLGTCWLGGTFARGSFADAIRLRPDEILPCVSPAGYILHKRTLLEKVMRTAARSSRRKPWRSLFFQRSFDNPVDSTGSEESDRILEAVRQAPSASNRQPWRVVYDPDNRRMHLYMFKQDNYTGNKLGFVIQRIDMGIAMCHLQLAAGQYGISGTWVYDDPGIFTPLFPNGTLIYIRSWIPDTDV